MRTNDTILGNSVTANEQALRLMAKAPRNRMFKYVIADALDMWRFKYLRRRVDARSVKRSPFHYRKGGNTPMVKYGRLIKKIVTGKITVSKQQGASGMVPMRAKLSLPFGHAVPIEISNVFKVGAGGFLADEIQDMARHVERGVAQFLQAATEKKATKKRAARITLSREQQAELKAGPKRRALRFTTRSVRG